MTGVEKVAPLGHFFCRTGHQDARALSVVTAVGACEGIVGENACRKGRRAGDVAENKKKTNAEELDVIS